MRVERAELVEGVIPAVPQHEAVRVIQSTDGWGHVKERIIRVLSSQRSSDGVLGGGEEILIHAATLAHMSFV